LFQKGPKVENKRIVFLDLIRGILIIGVVFYHLIHNLEFYFNYNIDLYSFWPELIRIIGASLFILMCGITANYSKNTLKRGIQLFGLGMLITIVTYLFDPVSYVKFGILHLLGTSLIIYHFYRKVNYPVLYFLLGWSIILTIYIQNTVVTNSYLFPLGLFTRDFTSADYYPIFGYIIPFLMGNIIGKYMENKKIFYKWQPNNILTFFGRHSLIIYLIHQPIIIGILYLIL